MKAVVILGSARADGHTAQVVGELSKHMSIDVVNLLDFEINYFDYEHAHTDDDFLPLMRQLVENYEVFIFATPVYWYTMSAQLKTFIDRFSDLLTVEKDLGRQLRQKSMAALSCSYADDLVDGFFSPFRHMAKYLGMSYLDDVHAYSNGEEQLDDIVVKRIINFANSLKAYDQWVD